MSNSEFRHMFKYNNIVKCEGRYYPMLFQIKGVNHNDKCIHVRGIQYEYDKSGELVPVLDESGNLIYDYVYGTLQSYYNKWYFINNGVVDSSDAFKITIVA